jgi:signal transduction histidine kinase
LNVQVIVEKGRTSCADKPEQRAFDVVAELVARTLAIANGGLFKRGHSGMPRPLMTRIDACERSARRVASGSAPLAPAAAVAFLGESIAAAAIEGAWPDGATATAIELVADGLGATEADTGVLVFRAAVSTHACAQLPPSAAIDFILSLLVDTGVTADASLWAALRPARTDCVAAAGPSPRSRRMREAARGALDGVFSDSETFRVATVERWDHPYAALVARSRVASVVAVDALLAEAAAALSPVLEREALFDRSATREHTLVSAGERRLVRLGFDLHDGPLQELVAFAEDLRVARANIEPLLATSDRLRAGGCFDDLTTRLGALDRELRQIAHSVRSTTALERPLADALRWEVEALRRAGVDAELSISGEIVSLTDSQKIVIYRVVQEALNNVRKHSGAAVAKVNVRGTSRLVEVTVVDDGCGLAGRAAANDRLGLAGVTERVQLLGGAVTIESPPAGGTSVRVALPRWRASSTSSDPVVGYAVPA